MSFDQLGLRGWHELTECYTAIGWTVTERIPSRSDAANNWQYIVARLQRDTQRATLVYSIFDGAGNPMQTPDDSPSWLEQRQVWGNDTLRETMRTLQAQVLIAHAGDLPEELEQEIIQLHLVTRDRFKSEWLAKSNTIASSTEQL